MSEEILRDLAGRLEDKMHRQMADFIDLCHRADCDMEAATHHMISILVKEALIGMVTIGMNKKDILRSVGIAHDILRPNVEKIRKEVQGE